MCVCVCVCCISCVTLVFAACLHGLVRVWASCVSVFHNVNVIMVQAWDGGWEGGVAYLM